MASTDGKPKAEMVKLTANVVVAIATVGLLAVNLWNIPSQLDTKIQMLRLVLLLTELIAVVASGYLLLTTKAIMTPAFLVMAPAFLALYALFIIVILFVTESGPITRVDVFSVSFGFAYAFTIPIYAAVYRLILILTPS